MRRRGPAWLTSAKTIGLPKPRKLSRGPARRIRLQDGPFRGQVLRVHSVGNTLDFTVKGQTGHYSAGGRFYYLEGDRYVPAVMHKTTDIEELVDECVEKVTTPRLIVIK